MRIILTMVGIALGIAIAVVAGVYGWQQFNAVPVVIPVAANPAPVTPPKVDETKAVDTPKPPTEAAKPATPVPAPVAMPTPAPVAVNPGPLPTPAPTLPPVATAPGTPSTVPSSQAPMPGTEGKPLPPPIPEEIATPAHLEQLQVGMTEGDVQQVMGNEGVETPENQLPQFTPVGWSEVRWTNPDGSYIAALFNEERVLAHVLPFNMPGAYAWMTVPHYAVPAWLNDKLQANNMIVRVAAVDVVEARASTFQFRGPLVDANGEVLGAISGTYYTDEAAGQFARAMEGSYEYALPDGRSDANTFQLRSGETVTAAALPKELLQA